MKPAPVDLTVYDSFAARSLKMWYPVVLLAIVVPFQVLFEIVTVAPSTACRYGMS